MEAYAIHKNALIKPRLARIKFASRGNVDRHDKRSSHITVCVSDTAKGVK